MSDALLSRPLAMHATLTKLIVVRSQLADDLRSYSESLRETCDLTPWRRLDGTLVRLSDVAIPVRVLKEEERRKLRPNGQEKEGEDEERRKREQLPVVDRAQAR